MENQLDRVEWKLDQILAALLGGVDSQRGVQQPSASSAAHPKPASVSPIVKFTPKQHAVLQMLLRGAGNIEIGERFGVTENTAKVYVRSIAGKLGVNTRAQIVMKTLEAFNEVDEASYMLMAGGLPKDWDEAYVDPDPFKHVYTRGSDE